MKAESEDADMLPEYDLSQAVRGRFAGLTRDQREAITRESRTATVREWRSFATQRVHGLEAALFTYLVLGQSAHAAAESLLSSRSMGGLEELVTGVSDDPVLEGSLKRRFQRFAAEASWLARGGAASCEETPAARLADVERLERIGRDADVLRSSISRRVAQKLAGTGMSRQEIERKTEETAKLWLAA